MSLGADTARLPRITVIIAVRNGVKTLQRALDSVFEQTYDDVELIIMDGASTDGTQAILEANTARIAYWESEPDGGIYQAWNKALGHVTGDWICFLGADDRYHAPDVMAKIALALLDDHGRHRVVFGIIDMLASDGSVVSSRGSPWNERRRRRFRQGTKMIPHPATFHDRSVFEDHGRFDERFRIAGDYEFLLREILDRDPLFVPHLVVDMFRGGLSNRPSSKYIVEWEIHRARYMHGLVRTPPWRSRRLLQRLAGFWVARNVTPRVAAARRLVTRSSDPPG